MVAKNLVIIKSLVLLSILIPLLFTPLTTTLADEIAPPSVELVQNVETIVRASSEPDEFGYAWDESIPYEWIDVSGGTDTGLNSSNHVTGAIALPFTFSYYGNEYSQVYIQSHGCLSFTDTTFSYLWSMDSTIPDQDDPDNVIAPYWGPIALSETGWVRYSSGGDSPDRYFVVEWNDLTFYPGESYTFQTILYENGEIDFQYKSMIWESSIVCAMSGIEDSTGSVGLAYTDFCAGIPQSNTSVRFVQNPIGQITQPGDGYTTGPASMLIEATAEFPGGTGIDQVEFLGMWDGEWHQLGSDTSEPYSAGWSIPGGLSTQQIHLRIDITGLNEQKTEAAGGIVKLNFIQTFDEPTLTENWISDRIFLNQRSLNPPTGDEMCSAASMAMVLAMEGVIADDYYTLSSKAIEMYPEVLIDETAYVYKMVHVLNREGTNSQFYGSIDNDAGWNQLKQQIDDDHSVIVRTKQDTMTSNGHFFVAVGYQELQEVRTVIAYDPFGKWKGLTCSELGGGCEGNYYQNSTEPSSAIGRWVIYDFDKVFGNYLIIAHNPHTGSPAMARDASTEPDPISDEPKVTGTYAGVITKTGYFEHLPIFLK